MAKEEEEIFFVEVRQPNEVKRQILESLKGILESLQHFEKFKEIRKQKLINLGKLRKDLKEINKHIGAIKGMFPESKLRTITTVISQPEPAPESTKKSKKKKKKGKKQVVVREMKPVSELDKLTSELSAIEEKLQQLQ